MKQSISKITTNDGTMIEIESKYLRNNTEEDDDLDFIEIREDLIEVYDDMDLLERHRMRNDYLWLQQLRCNGYKKLLWQYILDKDYSKQVDILSEMFIQYLSDDEFQQWLYYINDRDKFERFFSIFRTRDTEVIGSVHGVILDVLMEDDEECF